MPLVNEVVIGLPDKDKFNGSKPKDDGQFATYVTNPTLPALVEIALATPGIAPTNFPRTDLVTTFLTGIAGVNQPKAVHGVAGYRRRLRDAAPEHGDRADGGSVAEPARPARRPARPAPQDLAGYPNGRRPNDDVVDISLIAVMGGLCVANGTATRTSSAPPASRAQRPLGTAVFGLHDGVDQAGPKVKAHGPLLPGFPYLGTPLPGAQ